MTSAHDPLERTPIGCEGEDGERVTEELLIQKAITKVICRLDH